MRQIVAMGGGGFSMEPDNTLLDRYILGLTQKARPRICFIGTASGDSQGYIDRFYATFKALPCEPFHFSLFKGTPKDSRAFLLGMDILYVGGGNTRNLLILWKEWGIDQLMKDAWNKGIILAGISAGSICWFEQGVTDSIPGMLSPLNCLGLIKGSNCPHYDGEKERRPTYRQLLQDGSILPGIAADDGVALHYVDEALHRVVTSRPDAKAFRLELKNGLPKETPVDAEYLGGDELLIRRAACRDARGIHDAHMRSIQENCSKDYTAAQIQAWGGRPYDEEMRLKKIANDYVWVIENNGKIEGFGHLVKRPGTPKIAEIMGLYLTPEVKGKGLGKRILNLIEELSIEEGIKILELGSTLTALAFYQSLGFEAKGPQAGMKIGGVDVPYVPMAKSLEVK